MSDIRIKLGNCVLIDDGNGIYRPDIDPADRIVDQNGIVVAEESREIQSILKELGIKSLNGIWVKNLASYVEVLKEEKPGLRTCSDRESCLGIFEKLKSSASGLRIDTSLDSPFISQLMEYMGEDGCMLPLYLAQASAEKGRINSLEAELKLAEETAEKSGRNIDSQLKDLKRTGYKNAISQAITRAEKYIGEKNNFRWLEYMNSSLDSALEYIEGASDVFGADYVKDMEAKISRIRKDGYREKTKGYLSMALKNIDNTNDYRWLDHMDSNLQKAEKTAKEGSVYGQFADRITGIRRQGYEKKVNSFIEKSEKNIENQSDYRWLEYMDSNLDSAKGFIDAKVQGADGFVFTDTKRKELHGTVIDVRRKGYGRKVKNCITKAEKNIDNKNDYRWLEYMNDNLNTAIEFVNSKVSNTKEDVFPEKEQKELLKTIEATRRNGYRGKVNDKLESAQTSMQNDQDYRWLKYVDDNLSYASSFAIEGKVEAEFSGKITEMRRSGYKKKIDALHGKAKRSIGDKQNWRWKDNAKSNLDSAIEFIDAKIPGSDEDVFTGTQRKKMKAEIGETRKEIK